MIDVTRSSQRSTSANITRVLHTHALPGGLNAGAGDLDDKLHFYYAQSKPILG